MKIENKKVVPLVVLRDVKELLRSLRKLTDECGDSVMITEGKETIIVEDKDPTSSFFFKVEGFSVDDRGIVSYNVSYAPINELKIETYIASMTSEGLIPRFKRWLSYIQEYNLTILGREDKYEKLYEEEFTDLFEIVDSDADVAPFDVIKQIFLDNYLKSAINLLENGNTDTDISDVIAQLKSVKNDIPNASKKNIIRGLSKGFAKLRKKSIPLLKEILKEFQKELIKRGISWGLDHTDKILSWII